MRLLIHLLLFFTTIAISTVSVARIDVLNRPAIDSALVEKSVLIDLVKHDDEVIAVGERGHIIAWQQPGQWRQESVPVSVLLTAVNVLSDGTKIAVGHDSAIVVADAGSDQWRKVFDGYQLLDLKVALFERQIDALENEINAIDDVDMIEELEFVLEEYNFSLEDALIEQEEGPNKPLLSIAVTSDDQVFVAGPYGTLLQSLDKGNSWALLDYRLDNPDKFHLNSIISTTDDVLYIVGESSTAFVS
ncbi:MAG: sialidase, partial [Pseudomonadota bacterium]